MLVIRRALNVNLLFETLIRRLLCVELFWRHCLWSFALLGAAETTRLPLLRKGATRWRPRTKCKKTKGRRASWPSLNEGWPISWQVRLPAVIFCPFHSVPGVSLMRYGLLFVLVLLSLASFSLGCSEGPKHEEGKNPFKERQDTQKEKNQDKFMKPRMPAGAKGQ